MAVASFYTARRAALTAAPVMSAARAPVYPGVYVGGYAVGCTRVSGAKPGLRPLSPLFQFYVLCFFMFYAFHEVSVFFYI